MTADATLAADVDACCRLSGTFTLRSGQVSDEYFDKYLFESDPALLARVAAQTTTSTTAPASRRAFVASRTAPPVVMTSSTSVTRRPATSGPSASLQVP